MHDERYLGSRLVGLVLLYANYHEHCWVPEIQLATRLEDMWPFQTLLVFV